MTDYPYPGTLVADPITFQRAANAMVTVYDANDTTNSTPLALKDMSGLPMANPVKSSADAFIPPMICPTEGRKLVGAGLTVVEFSPEGIKNAATDAATAAQDAANSASTAAGNTVATAAVDNSGVLVLTKASGATVNAGNVIGPQGPKGDTGSTGPQGPQGLAGVADDASVAQQVTNGAATKAALNATYAPVTGSPNYDKAGQAAALSIVFGG